MDSNNNLVFSIGQKGNKALLEAIKLYLLSLSPKWANQDVVNIYNHNKVKGIWSLVISQRDFLEEVLIPFLDNHTFRTKKYLDYCDWKHILFIRKDGFHYTLEGKRLIEKLKSQMNQNRLSSKIGKSEVDRTILYSEINKLLSMPSNYEERDGKIWIVSENRYRHVNLNDYKKKGVEVVFSDIGGGNSIKSFNSITACAEFLGITRVTLSNRLKKNNPCEALYNNQPCEVRLIPSSN